MDEITETLFLEDKKEYGVIDRIIINNIEYLYLCNLEDLKDFCVRKVVGEEILGLNDKEEFDTTLLEFIKKHEGVL